MINVSDRIPFTLLGGYLGAGKTTLLNQLLTASSLGGRRIAVLVNDVAAVNVDAALIADHVGPTLALTNGCVCCTIGDDLTAALEEVRGLMPRPDQVVMELSGVGEPDRLAAWANTTGFRLDGIVVAADADQIVEVAARRFVGDTVKAQLSAADVVVLTKTDVAGDVAGARRFVTALTTAPVLDGAGLDPVVLFGLAGDPSMPGPGSCAAGSHVSGSVAGTPGVAGHRVEALDVSGRTRADLAELVNGLDGDAVRAKGLIRCVDTEVPVEVQVVGRRRSLRDRPDLSAESGTLIVIRVSSSVC